MIVCERFRWRPPAVWLAAILISIVCLTPGVQAAPSAPAAPDDGFAQRHPRLLFSSAELPVLRGRVHDGGADDEAYAFIRGLCLNVYPGEPFDSLLQDDAALEAMINLVLVSHFEAQVDSNLVNLGRDLTLHIARNWSVDTDPYGTSLRLRAMSLGFDHFFVRATPTERAEIRAEASSYMSYMSTNLNFDIWMQRPYVSNKTAMVSGALGLAAICFKDELPANVTSTALAKADAFYQSWRDAHLSSDGCYREGSLYIGWSMRNLVYYFAARKRYDGVDYSQEGVIQAIERWMPYELDPRGDGRVNNIQDQTDYYRPFARHSTFWAWAQSVWRSGLAAYMWEHSAGPKGKDMLDENDKASTVLWHIGIPPVNPGQVLEKSNLWEDRGLYYFRSGWADTGPTSPDVVFSFYSGEFRGGHAQEDQNQFTLAAYGEKLILDQGAGSTAKQSEAHNLIRIDGLGEHNAGSSIGTDGKIVEYVLSNFADYVCGDATLAYSTYSPYNNPGVPYPWSNWSWGYSGANPVQYATRKIVAVHGDGAPPYFLVRDDIRKDDTSHHYDWCLHVGANATVDVSSDPLTVVTGGVTLRAYPVYPARAALTANVTTFDNYNADPNSRLLMLGVNAIDPHFGLLLLPLPTATAAPEITRTAMPGGAILKVGWASGVIDDIVMQVPPAAGELSVADPFPWAIATDAPVAVVRKSGPQVTSYTLVDGTWLTVGAVLMAAVDDGPASLVFDGNYVHVSRPDAQFRVRADAVDAVFYRSAELPSHTEGEFLVSGYATGVASAAPADLQLRVYPNPFNPSVQMTFVNPARNVVDATIHDAQGRTIRKLVSRTVEAGELRMTWDGRDDGSNRVASGVYFLRVRAGTESVTRKLVLLR